MRARKWLPLTGSPQDLWFMARKTTAEMLGEALREFSILLFLFAPLEQVLVKEQALTPSFVLPVLSLVVLSLAAGIVIERLRNTEG